jgi:kynureninase
MEMFDAIGMETLRKKSERLTGYLEYLLDHYQPLHVTSITPRDSRQRGAQLSLRVERHGPAVHERLARTHVVCDWREPDVIRVAPVPLYNSFVDVHRFVEILTQAVTDVAAAN